MHHPIFLFPEQPLTTSSRRIFHHASVIETTLFWAGTHPLYYYYLRYFALRLGRPLDTFLSFYQVLYV